MNPVIQIYAPVESDGSRAILPARGSMHIDGRSATLQVQVMATNGIDVAPSAGYNTVDENLTPSVINDSLSVSNFARLYNGVGWDLQREASAANMLNASSQGAALVAQPGEYSVTDMPSAGVRAVATAASSGVGTAIVVKSISGFMTNDATPATATRYLRLRDGAGGPTLWAGILRGGAYANGQIIATGLNIVCSEAADAVLEFDSAPDASHVQAVSMSYTEALT